MYKRLAYITIGAVFFLILIGGVVRATGSGMGCPDWPRCFGSWIPPVDERQLPVNYREIYGAKLKGEVEFNAFKTWTEYLNRLLGALIGIFILAAMLSSTSYWKKDRKVVSFSVLAFILVVVEGWLGAKVVYSELEPGLITLHMLLAIAIVWALIYALYRAYKSEGRYFGEQADKPGKFLLNILTVLSMGQLVLGTQVREKIDQAYNQHMEREHWIGSLDARYYFHIALAILIVSLAFGFYKRMRFRSKGVMNKLGMLCCFLIILEFVAGALLGLFQVPAIIQPVHLLLSAMIVSVEFVLILFFNEDRRL